MCRWFWNGNFVVVFWKQEVFLLQMQSVYQNLKAKIHTIFMLFLRSFNASMIMLQPPPPPLTPLLFIFIHTTTHFVKIQYSDLYKLPSKFHSLQKSSKSIWNKWTMQAIICTEFIPSNILEPLASYFYQEVGLCWLLSITYLVWNFTSNIFS